VPTHFHAATDASYSQLGTRQPQKHEVHLIALLPVWLEATAQKDRLARVVSNPKLRRCRASSLIRASITRPAATVTDSGANAESPAAMGSEFTYSRTPEHRAARTEQQWFSRAIRAGDDHD
jgi:hypothetical protein